MREWWQRQSLRGTSTPKLAGAGLLVVAAVGVVLHDLFGSAADGEPPLHQGAAAALAASADGAPQPRAAAPAALPATAPVSDTLPGTAPRLTPAPAPTGATQPTTGVPLPVSSGSEPDWGALFTQLMAREDAKAAAAGSDSSLMAGITAQLSGFHLRAIVHDPQGGMALLNSRLLRVGDSLDGTGIVVTAILPDRLQLQAPGHAAPVELLLQPMHSAAGHP